MMEDEVNIFKRLEDAVIEFQIGVNKSKRDEDGYSVSDRGRNYRLHILKIVNDFLTKWKKLISAN